MGITSNDIAAQRATLQRGDEKRKAAKQAEERERLRDTFAAAALTGLIANGDYSVDATPLLAYRMADAMLRERGQFDRSQPIKPDDTLTTQATPSEGSVRGEGTVGERLVERVRITQSLLDDNEKLRAEIAQLQEAIRRLAEQDATLSVCEGNVTVTLDATLADAEREAVEIAIQWLEPDSQVADELRELLERLK